MGSRTIATPTLAKQAPDEERTGSWGGEGSQFPTFITLKVSKLSFDPVFCGASSSYLGFSGPCEKDESNELICGQRLWGPSGFLSYGAS